MKKKNRFIEEPSIEEIRRTNKIHKNVQKRQAKKNINKENIVKENVVQDIEKDNTPKKNETKKDNRKHKSKKTSIRPKSHLITKIFAVLISMIIIIGFIGGLFGCYVAYKMLEDKPTLNRNDLIAPESSVIYDSNGNVISELGQYKRENIDYEEMPNCLVDAFLAIEDSRFFEHFGFDIPRFSKAIIENIKARDFAQGGSTFNMQLIKNTYFQIDDGENSTIAEKKISRKMQEIFLAIEADQTISKQEIFADYLNRINFGNNIRGIEKAAQYYFDKSASELNLSESAFLAGLINSPNFNNPYNELIKYNEDNIYVSSSIEYLKNGTKRRNEVLDMMVYHGYITEDEAELAKAIKLEDLLSGIGDKWSDTIPYYQSYIDAVIDEAEEMTGKNPTVYSMKIYTCMDDYMQRLVYDIQNDNNPDVKFNRDDIQSAIVSMNNQTGEIVALGGGSNQKGSLQWNRATMSKIQPGSTVKPIFEYILAFDQLGWSTSHTVTDRPIWLYGSDHLIRNASGTYDGDMTIDEAVARSLNTPAIQTLQAVIDAKGEQFCIDYLRSIGFDIDENSFDLQYAIGGNTFQVTPVQLAGAHAIVLNGGRYIKPHTISRIEMSDGTVYEADTTGNRVVDEGAAYMTSLLEYNNVYGSWFNYMQILKTGYPVYAKTGTTDWADTGVSYGIPVGAAKDSWLVCSTSQYTNVIWLGFDRMGNGTYFRYSDDNYNLKGRIGKKLIIEEVEHFGFEPTAIARPDDVKDIKHVLGLYPYVEPQIGQSVTGVILEKYYKLNPVSSIVYETKEGVLSGVSASFNGDGTITINWLGVGGVGGEGMQDLSATNYNGKTEHAAGRLFFPRYTYITPNATYYAEVKVNGETVNHVETTSTSYVTSVSSGGNVEVCAWYSLSDERFCTQVK